ncbi:MAG: glutamate--tRNA ligase [Epulopiscium sp.]|nr:glutamate--tRNA ligase [Candidatus Epulonipiscium sp.]
MNITPERVRFAPSPTGYLHIGGARTALFNYLYAKKTGGSFLVRIEDTDLARSTSESEEVIIRDLHWLGIHWDEGIEVGGDHGPYRSMERQELYQPFIDQLLAEGKAYHCYCTQEEVEAQREQQRANHELPRYTGKCRDLTEEQKAQYEKEGRVPVVRFKVPEDQTILVQDLVRGNVEFDSNGVGDFVIVKSDGAPVYNFAVVIDDHLMEITTVIRGEEHLSNTPRQILLYEALNVNVPKFAHVSLILGEDRSKMSKRHGSTHVDQYYAKGYLPEAIVNFLVLLGWSPEDIEEEIFTLSELEKLFSLDRVTKNPAVFDIKKLNWMNGQYIRKADIDRITDLSIPFFVQAGYITEEESTIKRNWLTKIVEAARERLEYLEQIIEHARIFFDDSLHFENEEAESMLQLEHVPTLLKTFREKVEEVDVVDTEFASSIFKILQKETGAKGKNLFMCIRVALSGQCHGMELVDILELLGKDKILTRIDKVLAYLG